MFVGVRRQFFFLKFSPEASYPNKAFCFQDASMEGHLYVFLISSQLDKRMVAMDNSCFWLDELFSSETRRHNELLHYRNNVCEYLYKISIFRADLITNMAAIGSSCLWLVNQKKFFCIKPFGQINWNLVGCTYGRFCQIKFPQNNMTGSVHWASSFS